MERKRTKFIGVYEREAENRKNGNKMDVCFDITYKKDGQKIWEKAGWLSEGYSAKLAADIRSERIRSMRHNEELPHEKKKAPLLKEVWKEYKKWAETNKSRAGRDDISRYQNHIQDRFQDKRLDKISSYDLQCLKADLTKEMLSPASVKHCLILIRQIYNKAIAWDMYHGENPTKKIKMPTLQNQRTRFLRHQEADLLLEYLKKPRPRMKQDGTLVKIKDIPATLLHDITLLSLHTGMRAGEIFALKGQDIDFENGIITIRDTKNKKTRHAYMTNAVKEMLTRRIPENSDSLIFPDKKGNQAQEVSQYFRRAVNTLGFNQGVADPREIVIFHTLRHTFASWLALQGETLHTIKELLGHKSMEMTERYSHLIPDYKRRATVELERVFNESRKNEEGEIAVE